MSRAYYNEINNYCCAVLRKNIVRGYLPDGYVDEKDIKRVNTDELLGYSAWHLFAGIGGIPLGFQWAGWPDSESLLTAGFPCQPVSNAGKRQAQNDPRWLWPETARIIKIVRPVWIFLENVPGLVTKGADTVLSDLESMGYKWWSLCVGAWAVGASQRRDRVWIVAHSNGGRCGASGISKCQNDHIDQSGERLADTECVGLTARGESIRRETRSNSNRRCATAGMEDATGTRDGQLSEVWQETNRDPDSNRTSQSRVGNADFQSLEIGQGIDRNQSEEFPATQRTGIEHRWPARPGQEQFPWEASRLIKPGVGRSVNGVSKRVAGLGSRREKLKALGNSVCPQVVEQIARAIMATCIR